MMNATIDLVRSASSWILHPTRLIDRFLDRLEKLSAVLVVTAGGTCLSCSEASFEGRLDGHFGTYSQRVFSPGS